MDKVAKEWLPVVQEVLEKEGISDAILHSCALLCIGYLSMLLLCESIRSRRQRAWILTFFASAVMTIGSLPTLFSFLFNSRFNLSNHPTQYIDIDVYLCCFFMAYLIMDLFIGMIHYRDQIYLLSGWIHHLSYSVLMIFLIKKNLTTSFVMLGIMELPTFVLSVGHIWKSLRNDMLFGLLFFSTRIIYHGAMLYQFYRNYPVEGPWWLIVAGVYPLHIYWFNGWINQQKRHKKKKSSESIPRKDKPYEAYLSVENNDASSGYLGIKSTSH